MASWRKEGRHTISVLMRDVAKRSGVSTTTVSHVLNETRRVAEATRARVLRAAAELNYYKNTSARLLVRGQSDLLGLIISDIENPFFPELIKSFERACAGERLEVLLCATNYDRGHAENALRRMLENRVRGVAVMTSQFDPELEAHLTDKDVPLVLLGSPPARKFRSNIAINYRQGLSEAIRYLHKLGHREIALATGPQDQVSAIAFKEAAIAEMRKLGLKPFCITEGDHRPESGARAAQELLGRSPRPTALLCGNDRMAIGALGAAEDLGFRVPQDLSIIGADDVWMTRYCHPPLTTIRIPRDLLGQLAFDVLMKMVRSKRKQGSEHVLDTRLILRGSAGEAAKNKIHMRQTTVTRANA
ncbi:MAG: LacI family transcriptional regulator [Acidobacteriota bacterium]|nr:LacI family transcriptional regulator [Acidobacteriota bacterium]